MSYLLQKVKICKNQTLPKVTSKDLKVNRYFWKLDKWQLNTSWISKTIVDCKRRLSYQQDGIDDDTEVDAGDQKDSETKDACSMSVEHIYIYIYSYIYIYIYILCIYKYFMYRFLKFFYFCYVSSSWSTSSEYVRAGRWNVRDPNALRRRDEKYSYEWT